MKHQDPDPQQVPAGGAGADTGSVDAARIDKDDQARVPNRSSQNDVAGVGTRGPTGNMETTTPDTEEDDEHPDDEFRTGVDD